MNRSPVGWGRSCCIGVRAGVRRVLISSIASTGRGGAASAVGKEVGGGTLGCGIAGVPGIMRAYCEWQSLGPVSHDRFVVKSPMISQTPVQALRYGETAFGEDGPEQRNLRLAQLVLDLSGDEAPCLVGSQHEHQAVAGLDNARRKPGDWSTPQNGKVELRREFAKPR